MSELLLLLILALIFIFTPDTYIGSKYRLSVYLICNNRYRPWKTHIGRPLVLSGLLCRLFHLFVFYLSVTIFVCRSFYLSIYLFFCLCFFVCCSNSFLFCTFSIAFVSDYFNSFLFFLFSTLNYHCVWKVLYKYFFLSVILPVCFFVSVCCSHSLSVCLSIVLPICLSFCSVYHSICYYIYCSFCLVLSVFYHSCHSVCAVLSIILSVVLYMSFSLSSYDICRFTDVLWTLSVIWRTDGVLTAKLFRLRLGIEKPSNLFAHISLWCALLCSSAGAARPLVFCTERNVGWTGLPFWNWKIHSCWKPQSHARKRNKYKSRMCLTSWKQVCCFLCSLVIAIHVYILVVQLVNVVFNAQN